MPATHSPIVKLRRLGRELRKMREDFGLLPEAVAAQLGWSRSKVSRIETGRTTPRRADVVAVCDLYGIDSSDKARLVQLASEARQRGWWAAYADVFTGSYIGLEDNASLVWQWEARAIPALLQTEDYARAVISQLCPQEGVERRVMARMARRTLLNRPDAPRFEAVIDEAVIRRPIGGQQTMAEQLWALLACAKRPNIAIRVLPFSAGGHAGLEGALTVLSFADDIDPDVAYVEGAGGDLYVESRDPIDRCRLILEQVSEAALSPEDSIRLFTEVKDEYLQ
jgi:transcriptional regulator with XRE-family HTH domain